MTIAIAVDGIQGLANAPVFGNISRTNDLELAVRATNPLNFIDLSGKDRTLTKVNDATILAPQGITCNGDGGVLSTLDESLLDNFTIMSVARLEANAGSASLVNNWCVGNYAAAGTGIGLYLREVVNGGAFNLVLRAVFYNRSTANATANQFVDMTLLTSVPARPSIGPHFFAMSQSSDSDGNAVLRVYCPSMGLSRVQVTIAPAANLSYTAARRRLNWAGAIPPIQIGAVPAAGSIDSNAHIMKVKEALFYSAELTEQEILNQYVLTKKWLDGDGAVSTSGWVDI